MNKETRTIYNCLGQGFWTKRKCSLCQKTFTSADFEQQNLQLLFFEVGEVKSASSPNYATLEGVIVELQHKQCFLTCSFNHQEEISKSRKNFL